MLLITSLACLSKWVVLPNQELTLLELAEAFPDKFQLLLLALETLSSNPNLFVAVAEFLSALIQVNSRLVSV